MVLIINQLPLPTEWRPDQLEFQSKETFDSCIDRDGMAMLIEDDQVWNGIKVLKNKGIRMRFVTAVNEENISFCRQIMKLGAEVYHNDRAKGNFEIADGTEYLCYISDSEDHTEGRELLFHTKYKYFVKIQQCLFDNLCDKAIRAKEKIKQIERGFKNDFVDTINESELIRTIVNNQLMSARDEILLLFSTTNSFYRTKYITRSTKRCHR